LEKKRLLVSFVLSSLSLALVACSSPEQKSSEKENAEHETHSAEWSYEGETGSEHWGDLDPANAACLNGKEQSPINIEIAQVPANEKLENLEINYIPSNFSLVNNGHTVQGNAETADNSIVVDGTEYELVQFHFHTPSEHQFNGQSFDMELHLVHQDANDQLAVLGLMIKEGASNPELEKVWEVLPKEETTEAIKLSEPIHFMSMLPKDQQSFRYNGSLTTPPCTEGVKWIVLEQPIEMSKEQIDAFRQIFPDNHRPVQPLEKREVTKN
jgi:carbonic anhydrase